MSKTVLSILLICFFVVLYLGFRKIDRKLEALCRLNNIKQKNRCQLKYENTLNVLINENTNVIAYYLIRACINFNINISSRNKDTYYFALFLIFPGILLFSIFVLLPVVETLFISFTNWNGYSKIINYVGFDTYLKVILISVVGGLYLIAYALFYIGKAL